MLMPRLCRRRKIWLVGIFALACVCFFFQLVGIRVLSSGDHKIEQSWYQQNRPKAHVQPVLVGVSPSDLDRYKTDIVGYFKCFDHSDNIRHSRINDDFCDCVSDGSDEPGTDACPNGRFYCARDKKFIPSGKVNDGICDCCDGSEEWNQTASIEKVKSFPHSSRVHVAPCKDMCTGSPDRMTEDEENMKQMGARLKQRYMRAGREFIGDVYGANGEFYLLSVKCFTHFENYAHYSVCPFVKVIQETSGSSFQLGKTASWELEAQADEKKILLMDDGDKALCPGSTRRKTYIYFVCGITDEIISIRETEECVYMVRFTTPAAC